MKPPPFLVHVAGAPTVRAATANTAASALQTCVPCGATLLDNTAWLEGNVAVMDGDERDGPTWWPAGALVATDRHHAGGGPVITYVVEANTSLDDDEQSCVTP